MKAILKKRLGLFRRKLSLNNYIFLIFLSLFLFVAVGNIIENAFISFPMMANVKWLGVIILCITGYYLLYKQRFLEGFKLFAFYSVLMFILVPAWFFSWADGGVTLLYLMLLVVVAFFTLNSAGLKCVFAGTSLLVSIGMLTCAYKFPELIQKTEGQNVFADSLIQLTMIFITLSLATAIYTDEHNRQTATLISLNARLEEMAIRDALTNLYNKRKITEILEDILKDEKRENIYVAMVDIDLFKSINDSYGHLTGDKVLRHIADHLAREVGEDGCVGRYGGDEFLLIMWDISESRLEKLLQRLMSVPAFEGGEALTISGGLSRRNGNNNSEMLISAADNLLLEAKKNGKNEIWRWDRKRE